jgi:hypothetical protein
VNNVTTSKGRKMNEAQNISFWVYSHHEQGACPSVNPWQTPFQFMAADPNPRTGIANRKHRLNPTNIQLMMRKVFMSCLLDLRSPMVIKLITGIVANLRLQGLSNPTTFPTNGG